MAARWKVCAVVCALVGVAVGLPMGEVRDRLSLIEQSAGAAPASAPAASEPKDDRSYGQIQQEKEDHLKDRAVGTTREGKEAYPLHHENVEQHAEKKNFRKDGDVLNSQLNAVAAHADAIQQAGEVPLQHVTMKDHQKIVQTEAGLKKADKAADKLTSTKAFHKQYEAFQKDPAKQAALKRINEKEQAKSDQAEKQPKEGAVQATEKDKEEMSYSKLFEESQKMIAEDKAYAIKEAKAHKEIADARKEEIEAEEQKPEEGGKVPSDGEQRHRDEERAAVDKQFKVDNDAKASVEDSPTFQGVVKDEQRDQQMEIAVEAQQKQYETLKKTGKEVPISKKALEPQKKKSHYEMAQEFLSSIKGEDEKSAEYQKEKAQYEARYAEGVRTDFQDAQEEDLTKHPKVQAEYAKLKAEKAKEGDIQGDIASLRAVETQQKNEHMQALYEVQKKAPTKEGVAELVKKGLVGAQQLQKDMEMQEKINEEAKKKGELPKTLEEVMKERSLMAAKRWQAETLLKEGQNAVIDSAVKVEQSGSAADLAVLEGNVKRLREGKPTLTGAEARETTKMADDKEKLSPLLGRDRMKAFRHGLTKASADATSEINATTTAVESTEQVTATMPYSGSDDELEPDSLNDPMFSKTVDSYGHSFSVEEDFDVDRQDDDAEMTALDDSDSYSTDAEDDAVQSAEDENELDQPEAELVSDATAGEHGAVDTYQEKLQSEAKLSKLSPSVVKLDDETENNDDDEAKLPDSADEAAEEPVSSGMEKPEVENEDEDEEVPENPTQAEDKDEDDESVPQ